MQSGIDWLVEHRAYIASTYNLECKSNEKRSIKTKNHFFNMIRLISSATILSCWQNYNIVLSLNLPFKETFTIPFSITLAAVNNRLKSRNACLLWQVTIWERKVTYKENERLARNNSYAATWAVYTMMQLLCTRLQDCDRMN